MARTALSVVKETQPHLRDLFRVGQTATIQVPTDKGVQSVDLWVRNPGPDHQQEAIRKAGVARARMRMAFKDTNSDEYIAMREEVDSLETRQDLEDFLASTDESELREQAYNEILYGEWGSNWSAEEKDGVEGLDYLNNLQAMLERRNQLEDDPAKPRLDQDPEYERLRLVYEQFQNEVTERVGVLRQAKMLGLQGESDEDLRNRILKVIIDLMCQSAWVDEYNQWMLVYAFRYPEDKKRLYFRDPTDVADLPSSVQAQLLDHFREVSRAGNDLKGSSSPEISSDLSEQSEAPEEVSNPSSPEE